MNAARLSALILDWARQGDDVGAIQRRANEMLAGDPDLAQEVARRWVYKLATDAVTAFVKPAGRSSRAPARGGAPIEQLTLLPAFEAVPLLLRRMKARGKIILRHVADERAWAYIESWQRAHTDEAIPETPFAEWLGEIGCPAEIIEALAA